MVISVYLHDEILNVLQHFGTLEDVANRIVDEAVNGTFDMETLDKCPPPSNAKKYYVNIVNSEYIEDRNARGARSSKLSLRRLLYHFVDNELYVELGWPMSKVGSVRDAADAKFNLLLARTLTDLANLYKLSKYEERVHVTNAIKELRKINRGN